MDTAKLYDATILKKTLEEAMPAIQLSFRHAIEHMAEAHLASVEGLTRSQFEDALSQAIDCGDFLRHVVVGGGDRLASQPQAVTYIPHRDKFVLNKKIYELKLLLRQIRDEMKQADIWRDWIAKIETALETH